MSAVRRWGAALAAVSVFGVGGTSYAAGANVNPPNGGAITVGGQPVALSTASGDGTHLDPGMYQASFPQDTTKRYLSVDYNEGEHLDLSLMLAARWTNGGWTPPSNSDEVQMQIRLLTEDGQHTCASDSKSMGNDDLPGALGLHITLDPADATRSSFAPDAECLTAKKLTVEISRGDTGSAAGELPAQIALVRTPKATSSGQIPNYKGLKPMETSPLQARSSVEPGAGFFDAATLQPGGYSVKATPGKVMFYRVHLAYGQRLSVGWQVPRNGTSYKPEKDMAVNAYIMSPSLMMMEDFLSSGRSSTVYADSSIPPSDAAAQTAPINYNNPKMVKDGYELEPARGAFMPGWYYVLLSMSPRTLSDGADGKSVDTTLSVRVEGAAQAGPKFAMAQPANADISGQPSSQAGTPAYVWVPLGLLGLAGVGVLAWWMKRRSA